jgi:hypothetical protein
MSYNHTERKVETMAGMAGSGFLEGFVDTTLALQRLKRQRDYDHERLAVQKEHLGLQRKVLEGQLASRKLQDEIRGLTVEKMLRDLGARLRSGGVPEGAVGGTLPFGLAAEPAAPGDEAPAGGDPESSAGQALAPADVEGVLRTYGRRLLGTPGAGDPAPAEVEQWIRDLGRRRQQQP